MDAIGVTQDRRSQRSRVLLKATLETLEASLPVILRNLSEDGALVSGYELPEEGARVLFHRQGLSVPSRIAWVYHNTAGVAFDFPLFPRELLRHVPPKEAKKPPLIKRRPGFAPQPLTEHERQLVDRWANGSCFALGD